MTEPDMPSNAAPSPSDQSAPAQGSPAKTPPERLVLRAAPRRVVRFKRSVIVGAAVVGSVAIAIFGAIALAPKAIHIVKASDDQPAPQRNRPAEAIAELPGDYSQIKPDTPVLGPPLPGDLGKPILDRQRELANEAGGPGMADASRTQQQQAIDAERQRIAAQAGQARESSVLAQSSARVAGTSVPEQAGKSTPDLSALATQTDAGRLTLDPDHDQNNQQRKLDFVRQPAGAGTDNPHHLTDPASPYQVMAGSIIAASLVTGLNSDLPGMVIAQVTENVYDTVTGAILLIPQGSRLIGSYDSVVAFGQKRALLVWQRLILPDGSSLLIDNLPATDAAGYMGLEDKVDYHTWQLLKGVGLSTLLGVGTQLSMDDESDLVRAIRQSAQQSGSQAGQQIVSKALNVQPTLTVRPGWPLRVIVHKDLTLRPWTNRK